MLSGTIVLRSFSASRSTALATQTAFEPFFLAMAMVTAEVAGLTRLEIRDLTIPAADALAPAS